MSRITALQDYLSSYNAHDITKIIDFLHPKCRVVFNGHLVLDGAEAMRHTYEQDFCNSNASAILLEHSYDNGDEDRIRALIRTTHDNHLIDVTYVFEPNENGDGNSKQRMIEHIIHSVTHNRDENK
ncbi:unnamed protein product [Adineta ricciae]|uniref:Nuclear transport factor 2 family protein n=1 Tax=Adineta ricciae TaxID=249248 RepID=A0A814QX95_ADIRI|nr:unnamed protein product [Adineta ricciae]